MSADELARLQSYWSLVAQVTPVLALALIVEARSLNADFSDNVKARRFFLLWLTAPLLWFTFSVPYALNVVGGGSVAHGWAYQVNSWVMGFTISLLFLNRVYLLTLGAWADPVARMVVRLWRPHASHRRNIRQGRRVIRRQMESLRASMRRGEELAARLADFEAELILNPEPDDPRWNRAADSCRTALKEYAKHRRETDKVLTKCQDWIERSHQANQDYAQLDAELRELAAAALAQQLHAFGVDPPRAPASDPEPPVERG